MLSQNSSGLLPEIKNYGCLYMCLLSTLPGADQLAESEVNKIFTDLKRKNIIGANAYVHWQEMLAAIGSPYRWFSRPPMAGLMWPKETGIFPVFRWATKTAYFHFTTAWYNPYNPALANYRIDPVTVDRIDFLRRV